MILWSSVVTFKNNLWKTEYERRMIELVNLEECVGYVVKVNRRDDTTLYGKIRVRPNDDYCPFILDLGNGSGVGYRKNGRVMKDADELDIIWIKKIAKEDEEKTEMTYPNEIEKTEGGT